MFEEMDKEKEVELKPLNCPFCNTEPKNYFSDYVFDHTDECIFTRGHIIDRVEVRRWNTRQPTEQLERLVGLAIEYRDGLLRCNVSTDIAQRNLAVIMDFINTKLKT